MFDGVIECDYINFLYKFFDRIVSQDMRHYVTERGIGLYTIARGLENTIENTLKYNFKLALGNIELMYPEAYAQFTIKSKNPFLM